MNKWLDRIQAVVEYLITIPFILSAVFLPFSDNLPGDGFIALVFGGHVALIVYALWFMFISAGLIYAKRAKKKKLHKTFLMCFYLTTIYTAILTTYIAGFGDAIDDLVIGAIAAICWMRWKFKTEYVNPRQFHSAVSTLKEDPPPLP